jgi:hypothetical protein
MCLSTTLLWAWLILPLTALAGITEGTSWLSTQPNADGSFGAGPAAIAEKVQSTAEVLSAYQALGQQGQPSFAPGVVYLNGISESQVEILARKIIVNAKAGNDVTAWANELFSHQNTDGGFSDRANDSSVLDTAFALEALTAANVPGSPATSAINYLLSHQQPNGGWLEGENSTSVYLSALAMRALWHYRHINASVPAVLTNARDFLLSQRDGSGSWGESFNTALSLIALIPYLPDLSSGRCPNPS